jgi:hypothetical protein
MSDSQLYEDARQCQISESDQEIFFTNQIVGRFCSSKRIYLTLNPS